MSSSTLHDPTTAGTLSADLYYELDAERYPTLGNEFFTRLRQKYPRAFQRHVPYNASQSSVRSTTSSENSKCVWSLWECNGDEDKAVVKEAGGVLIARSDLSADDRLKRISDSLTSVKTAGDELLVMLRSFRSALLANGESVIPQHGAGDKDRSHFSNGSTRDAAINLSVSNSVSSNSSCRTKSSKDDTVLRSETVDIPVVCDLPPGTDNAVSGIDATFTNSNTKHDGVHIQSVDLNVFDPAVSGILQQEEDAKSQMPSAADELKSTPSNVALPEECNQTHINQGSEESESTATATMQNNATSEAGVEIDNSSHIQPLHYFPDRPNTTSESYRSTSGHQILTDRKPPLMKKGKTQQRHIKSLFGENLGSAKSRSSFEFNDGVPEAPGSAEPVRRKLRLPWKKKKKSYMPVEEMSRWTSNFESWRSASEWSVETNSESDSVTDDRYLRRTASHTDMMNVDSVSIDTDTDVMSDDPLGESWNERAGRLQALSSLSVDISADTHQSRRSSLRSSAHKHFSSLQKAAGRRLLRLQKAMSFGNTAQDSTNNYSHTEQTANVYELSRKRARHESESSNASSLRSDIESPRHFRPIGRILSHNVADGTTTIELVRPPHGPYGIYLARDGDDPQNMVYISRLSDGLPVHFYAGLLSVGDQVLSINNIAVSGLSLDAISDMIALSSTLLLQLQHVSTQ